MEQRDIIELAREKVRHRDCEEVRIKRLNDGTYLVRFLVKLEPEEDK